MLTALPDTHLLNFLAAILIIVPVVSFVPLFAWKAHQDPDFCRSETHVQRIKKYELEAMGTESRQIDGAVIEQSSIEDSVREPLTIDHEPNVGAGT